MVLRAKGLMFRVEPHILKLCERCRESGCAPEYRGASLMRNQSQWYLAHKKPITGVPRSKETNHRGTPQPNHISRIGRRYTP